MYKSLLSNFSFLYSVQLFSYILPLVAFPYLSKVLSVDVFTKYLFVLSVIQFLYFVSELGLNLVATKAIADSKAKDNKEYIHGAVYVIKVAFLVILFASCYPIDIYLTQSNPVVLIYAWLSVALYALQPHWLFLAKNNAKPLMLATLWGKLVFLSCILCFVTGDNDFELLILLLAISNGITMLLLIIFSIKIDIRAKFSLAVTRQLLSKTYHVFIARVATFTPTSLPMLVLGYAGGVQTYSGADQLYKAARGVVGAFIQALYSHCIHVKAVKHLTKLIIALFAIGLIGILVVYLYGESVLQFLFNNTTEDTFYILIALLIASLFSLISQALGYPLFSLINKTHIVNNTAIITAMLFLVSIGMLYHFAILTAWTLAVSVLLSELFLCFLRIIFARKNWEQLK